MAKKKRAVGYKSPPEEHQFEKGRSGNHKGRPKGSKNFNTIVAKELKRKVRVKRGDREVEIPKEEVFATMTVDRAVKLGGKDSDRVLGFIAQRDAKKESAAYILSRDEEDVLACFIARSRAQWEQERAAIPPAEPKGDEGEEEK